MPSDPQEKWLRRRRLALLIAVVVLTRLPLLLLGYGSDGDAWRVAWRASALWQSGVYIPSRFPGFPVYEIVCAPLVGVGGSLLSNATTLLFFILALLLFRHLLSEMKLQSAEWLVWTFAFFPLLWKNSAVTLDYTLALALILASYLRFLKGDRFLAALLLGLAAGTRLSSIVLLLPMVLLLDPLERKNQGTRLATVAIVTAMLLHLPVFLWKDFVPELRDFFLQRPPISLGEQTGYFLYRGIYAIGLIGVGSIFVSVYLLRHRIVFSSENPYLKFAAITNIVFLVLFFVMPDEREYLIPAIPFLLVMLGILFPVRYLRISCLCLLSYALVSFDVVTHDLDNQRFSPHIAEGLIVRDFRIRRQYLEWRRTLATYPLPDSSICMTATGAILWFENGLLRPLENGRELLGQAQSAVSVIHQHLYYTDAMPRDQIDRWKSRGFRLYYIHEAKSVLDRFAGGDLDSLGAVPIHISTPR